MGFIIKEVKIPNELYSFISDKNEKEEVVKNLSKINIFVGENNSGKSRFLRSLLKKKNFEFLPNNIDYYKINDNIPLLKKRIQNFLDGFDKININTKIPQLKKKLNDIHQVNFLMNDGNYFQAILDLRSIFEGMLSNEDIIGEYYTRGSYVSEFHSVSYKWTGEEFIKIIDETFNLDNSLEELLNDFKFDKLYIPILRGLRPLNEDRNYQDLYLERTYEDYFSKDFSMAELGQVMKIFTGLDAYDTVNTYSRSNYEQKKLLNDFKNYLKNNFFDGKNIEITASVNENGQDDVLSVKIGEENEKPIHELGDGIQSIIILTLQLFLNKGKNLLIFIEEPEQYLHPGLQRKLIETFLFQEGFENFQFFFNTHSNHFLDITLDFDNISIFSVQKELDDSDHDDKVPSFIIKNLSEGDSSALELLGVRNSSVFLSNCTIWVEGVTDRHYLRHFIELYKKEHKNDLEFFDYTEDYHYSFVEYGGNNITHWSFLDKEEKPINVEKLCGRLFLLADKDQGKEDRHEQLKETLGEDRVHILKCNEIENIVSVDILLKIIKDYEKINEGDPLNNINTDIQYEDYKNELLGKFIEVEIFENLEKKIRKGNYSADSGTINNKGSFLKKFILYTQNWNDLTPEAKEITERVYEFIKENNS